MAVPCAARPRGAGGTEHLSNLIRVTPEDEQVAWALFCRRSNQRYSFTDCTSFELMRRLRIASALALDDDFRAEGFQVVP